MKGFLWRFLVIAMCVSFVGCCSKHPKDQISGLAGVLWWHVFREWQAPPPEAESSSLFTEGRFILFCPDGSFQMLGGTVLRQADGKTICISHGDGLALYGGHWVMRGNTLTVTYRETFSDILPAKDELPSNPTKVVTGVVRQGFITLAGDKYVPMTTLDKDDFTEYFSCR
jgi:hypothetical protein